MGQQRKSPRRDQFPAEYLVDLNATQAAIRCGYSPKSARQQAAVLLTDPAIQAEVQRLKAARQERVEVKADFVLRELMRIASVDVADLFDATGRLLPVHDMPEDVRRAMAGVDVQKRWEGRGDEAVEVTTVKVRMNDKIRALELLGKHLRLYAEVHEVEFARGLADRMKAAEARRARA